MSDCFWQGPVCLLGSARASHLVRKEEGILREAKGGVPGRGKEGVGLGREGPGTEPGGHQGA